MHKFKELISGFWLFVTAGIMWIPIHQLRLAYLRIFVKSIGKNTTILRNVQILSPRNVSIGDNTVINNNVLLDGRGGLTIGNNVDIAQEVNIWSLGHDVNDDNHKSKGGEVIIHDYVWIASRATILQGVTINHGAVIASCAVVTKDISTMTIAGGIPARPIGIRENKLNYKLNYSPWFR